MRDAHPFEQVTHAVVGSLNPVKAAAVAQVLARTAPWIQVRAVAASSGVGAQPWGDEETRAGATARARAALAATPEAGLGVGVEGGVVREADGSVRTCAWVVVVDRAGRVGVGGSLAMPLPPAVVQLLEGGMELGEAMDALARTTGTKQGAGAVGLLTRGLVSRQEAYEPLVAYALAPWLGAALAEGAAPTAATGPG